MSTDPHRPRRGGRGADLRAARPNPYYDFVCDDDVYLNDDCIYDDCIYNNHDGQHITTRSTTTYTIDLRVPA